MGVLSNIVIADKSEARDIAECDTPARQWEGIELKTLDPVKLGTLWAILSSESGVEAVVELAGRFSLLYEVSDDGPWVYEVPCDLRNRLAELAAMNPEAVLPVARDWASTEELQDWEFEEVASVVYDICDLADSARLQGKDLLLWISL
jgi:hypothetical protein